MLNRLWASVSRRLSIKWWIGVAALLPPILAAALFPIIDAWALGIAVLLAAALTFTIGSIRQNLFKRITVGIIRMRAVDREYRLPIDGPHEEARLARAVNRLADGVNAALASETARRLYHETILNEMKDAILVVSSKGILQYSNPAASQMFGFNDQDTSAAVPLASKINIYEINHAATISSTSPQSYRRIVELYSPTRYLEVISAPLPPEEQGVGRALLIVRDRTHEHRMNETMREFVTNASHELRTPIAAIQAMVEALKYGAIEDKETAGEFLDRIEDSARRMTVLVSDLMDLSLLETGRVTMHLLPIAPRELVKAVHNQFQPIAEKSKIDFRIDESDIAESLLVNVDREKMERVLGNLVSNALKFTPPDGQVSIGCQHQDGTVSFFVRDNGRGIGEDELPHIFERFYKANRDQNENGVQDDPNSFGLGLAIARNIVELHDGQISVQSALGEGSTFRVNLKAA